MGSIFKSILGLKMGSKRAPNRIINAEGVRKALDRHLRRYHSALGAILGALEGYKMAQRGDHLLQRFNSPAATACGEGGGDPHRMINGCSPYKMAQRGTQELRLFNNCATAACGEGRGRG